MLAATLQSLVDALYMRLEDTLFRIAGMFFNNDKFNPLQKTDPGKFFPGLLAPVVSNIYGDAVDFVKKLPTLKKIHGSFGMKKVDKASCCGGEVKSILY